MTELFCPKCGKGNPDGALICQYCDSPLVTFQPHDPLDQSPLQAEPILPEKSAPETPASQPDDSIPDWLASIREKKEQDFNEEAPSEPIPGAEPEKPDLNTWLAQLRGGTLEDVPREYEQPAQAEQSAESGEATPDWLSNIRSKINEENPEPQPTESPEHGLDWLSKLRKQTEELSPPGEAVTPSASVEQEGSTEVSPFASLLSESEPSTSGLPENVPGAGDTSDLHNLYVKSQEETDLGEVNIPNGIDLTQGDELPPPQAMYDEEETPTEKITTRGLPDWLSSFMGVGEDGKLPESALSEGTEEREPSMTGIEPGAIPSWVNAMRPVEPAAPPPDIAALKNTDRRFEESGPLAGIRGILPGQDIAISYGKPAAKSSREASQANVSLFEKTIQMETEEPKVPVYKRSKTSNVVRWILAVILLLVVVLVQAGGGAPDLLPKNIPVETMSLFRSVSALPQGSNILLVLDYESAYSGEIETAAIAPLSLMMLKQSNLYTVSTSSANLFLADKLLNAVKTIHPAGTEAYLSKEKYQVLGYLPGGQSGMQGLLHDFKTSLPVGLNLKRTAEMTGLTGVTSLNDFSAIMILTDNPDTARTWVEQIKPQLTKPAIWMAVTSQAVVLVRPYIRSGQIDGLISGVYGAASFEQIIQQPGAAAQIWNGYYTTLLLATILIIAGGFVNFIGFSILRARMKRENPA